MEHRSAEWLLVDEYSMLSPDLCAGLEHLRAQDRALRRPASAAAGG
jgi:hypothetical protein